MTPTEFKAMLQEKGLASLTPDVLKGANLGMDEVISIVQATAKAEAETATKPFTDRLNAIQAGLIPDNGVAGSGNTKDAIVVYEDTPVAQFSSTPAPYGVPGVTNTFKAPKFKRISEDMKAMFKNMEMNAKQKRGFCFNSSMDPEFAAASTSVADPSNAGSTLPPAFEEALIDTYIAASGWLSTARTITGPSKSFYYPQRPRDLDLTKRLKTLTAITAKRIGDGAVPTETTNTPWGWVKGEAVTYACYGRITREMLRGNPRSVNDFMQEMTRGINDIISYDAAWGEGNPKNEVLGFANQVDAKFKPLSQARATANSLKRVDLIKMLEKLHDYFKPGAFWMGQSNTFMKLAEEVDSQNRPLFLNFSSDISNPIEPPNLMGYPVMRNWQSPILGTAADVVLMSPSALWVFFQQALTIRSSEHVEFLEGNLVTVADVGWNTGVTLNKGIVTLNA